MAWSVEKSKHGTRRNGLTRKTQRKLFLQNKRRSRRKAKKIEEEEEEEENGSKYWTGLHTLQVERLVLVIDIKYV